MKYVGVIESDESTRALYKRFFETKFNAKVLFVSPDPPYKNENGFPTGRLDLVIVDPHPASTDVWIDTFRSHHDTKVIIASGRGDILTERVRKHKNVSVLSQPFHMSELGELFEVVFDPGETATDSVFH